MQLSSIGRRKKPKGGFTVIVHEFSLRSDGSWLTTGHDDIFFADDRQHAQSLSDRYGGHGKSVYAGGATAEACSALHSRYLVWEE